MTTWAACESYGRHEFYAEYKESKGSYVGPAIITCRVYRLFDDTFSGQEGFLTGVYSPDDVEYFE